MSQALDGELLRPGPAERWIGRVLPAAAGALGVALPGADAARAALGLPAAERIVVVLADGLGHVNLGERAGHAPFLRGLLGGSAPLLSTFPSTTATAVGSFGTGLVPGATGMLGYTVRDPATGRLGNVVSWTDLPAPEQWQPEPSVLAGLAAAGVRTTSVGLRRFEGSGMTRAALRGSTYRGVDSARDRVAATVAALREPGLVYLYWGEVDKVGHRHGWGSWQWGDELASLDRHLADLARLLPAGTVLAVTADHGMVDVDPTRRWDVATDPTLGADVELVAGEQRAAHVHLVAGSDPVAARDRWATTLGDCALVVTRDEAVEAGWFGPVREAVRPVIGDLVVAMRHRATVVDSRTQTPASLALVGVHGSLTPAEMLVPWLVTVT